MTKFRQPFLSLDIGLPVKELSQPIRAAVSADGDGASGVRLAAVNRRGRAIDVDVRVSALHSDGDMPDGVIVIVNRVDDRS